MENEDLYYKIRALLDAPDQNEPEWDPDKFWNLYEARKRKRERWFTLSYAMAATVIFAVTYVLFSDNVNKRFMENTAVVSGIHYSKGASQLAKRDREESSISKKDIHVQHAAGDGNRRAKIAHSAVSRSGSKRMLKCYKSDVTRQPANLSVDKSYEDGQGFNKPMPSLLRMFEQAQREREQRSLNVQLEDTANYNRFWLTVNQHLLANKLNSEHLHYARY